jgi:hypothetical protein
VAPPADEDFIMKTRSVVGVLVGGVVDIVATNIFALPVVMYVMSRDHLIGAGAGATQTLVRTITSDPSLIATTMVLGSLASVLGGYTAAWIAGRSHLLIGALSAYLCTVFGIVSLFHDTAGASLLQHLGGFVLSPALGLLGGYLRLLQMRRVARA